VIKIKRNIQTQKMKNPKVLVFSIATLISVISFTQCNNATPESLSSNAGSRSKLVSMMTSDNAYMNEVMDSMRAKHPDVIMSNVFAVAKNNKQMQGNMMDKMIMMCKTDSTMCKAMMGKTMDMCNADESKCMMMMGSMEARPNVKKSMDGMCDMKGMKMGKK
jgi:hypothetical protein